MEKILVVDDNKYIRFALTDLLENAGYKVFSYGEGTGVMKEVSERNPDLVLLDIKLPGAGGMKLLEEIKKVEGGIAVIMLTAFGEVRTAVQAMKQGAFDYITKPFNNDEIVITIKKALENRHLTQEVKSLRKKLAESSLPVNVIGKSDLLKQVLTQVEIIAPTNMTVVIQGESGTGKEVIANLIHKKSLRKDKPLVAIDCGAIPESLIESELFGYEKGAFTGADSQKEGKFEQAHGGTLFLDEVTNLSDSNQMKLLRTIEEKKLSRLGSKKDLKVDVRIIAATNTRLAIAVKQGKFRSDLYFRLNEFHIDLPLLKDRKDDIPLFIESFIQEANNELNRNVKGMSAGVMKNLLNYDWPGNVRELRNLVRRAVLTCESDIITSLSLIQESPLPNERIIPDGVGEDASYNKYTKDFERDLIMKALRESNGNKSKAAKILNMNERTFYRKIKSLGI